MQSKAITLASAKNFTKNPILHSQTKHIEIIHHFLTDHVEKGDVIFEYVDTKKTNLLIFLQNHYPLDHFTRYIEN